jgi:hypothetical protein
VSTGETPLGRSDHHKQGRPIDTPGAGAMLAVRCARLEDPMSKHADFVAAFTKARTKFDNNHTACIRIIEKLVDELASYLECDPKFITLHPPDVPPASDNACSAAGAIELGSDHAWHFQLAVTVGDAPEAPVRDVCVFGLSVGPLRLGYEIFLKGKHQKIPMGNPEQPKKAHDTLFTLIYDSIRLKYQEEFHLFEEQVTIRRLP